MKLTKPLFCAPPGEIYPRWLEAGDECPVEFEESARAQGCLGGADAAEKPKKPAAKKD
jgi:hypothetical protein